LPRRRGGLGWKNLLQGRRRLRWIREKPFGFRKQLLSLGDFVYLDGFWQSEQFFPGLRGLLQAHFQLARPPQRRSVELAWEIDRQQSVALHVRRGDYINHPTTGVCPPDYYLICVEALLERYADLRIYLFSDDLPWCKQHLRFPCRVTLVEHNGDSGPHEDLWLMTRCRHHIIANSSFSWWGAWLRADESGVVHAPQPWFLDQRLDTRSIVPANWTKIALAESSQQQAA
jgi:hypothetical protein